MQSVVIQQANEDCDEEISELLTPKSPTSEFNDDSWAFDSGVSL